MTEREATALDAQSAFLLPVDSIELDFANVWGAGMPVVLEIGFGAGTSTARMAADDPATGILAVDVHTPGVGDLLDHLGREALKNVRVMEADALAVLEFMIPVSALAGVRSFFPDPWPKARHHKRRLVQPEVLDLVASRLVPGGYWHLATDWPEYADAMRSTFAAVAGWSGGGVPRPADRPVTHYERRAMRAGRPITDFLYRRDTTGISCKPCSPRWPGDRG